MKPQTIEVENIGEHEWLITEGELKAAVDEMKNGKLQGRTRSQWK